MDCYVKSLWLRGQAAKTPPFHGGNMGSIPVGVTFFDKERSQYMDAEKMLEDFPTKADVHGSSIRKRNSQKKEFFRRKRLIHTHGYPRGGVIPVGKDGKWTDDKPVYLKRYYRRHVSKSIKRDCHRKFRRTKIMSRLPRSAHKKMTEYWWELA